MNRLLVLVLFVLASVGTCVRLAAQQLDTPVTVPLVYDLSMDGGMTRDSISIVPGEDYYHYVPTYTNYQYEYDDNPLPIGYSMRIYPPDGYTAYMNDVPGTEAGGSVSQYDGDYVKIRIDKVRYMDVGKCDDLRAGKVVWSVGLGSTRNGKPAGELSIRQAAINDNCFTPASLLLGASSPDTVAIRFGGTIRQVRMAQGLIDVVVVDASAYRLKFYARTQVGTLRPDGTYTVSGDPFVEYLIVDPKIPGQQTFRIVQTNRVGGGTARQTWTQLSKKEQVWECIPWNGASSFTTNSLPSRTISTFSQLGDGEGYMETISQRDSLGAEHALTRNYYQMMPWGAELVRVEKGDQCLTTHYEYYTDLESGGYGRLKAIVYYTGNWIKYFYHNSAPYYGLTKCVVRPFLDAPLSPAEVAPDSNIGDCTRYTYVQTPEDGAINALQEERFVNGVMIEKKTFDYVFEVIDNMRIKVTGERLYRGAGESLRTVTRSFASDLFPGDGFWPGLLHSIRRPDGTIQLHRYIWGNINQDQLSFNPDPSGTYLHHVVMEGVSSLSTSEGVEVNDRMSSLESFPSDFRVIVGKSTVESTVASVGGEIVLRQKFYFSPYNSWYVWMPYLQEAIVYEAGAPGWTARTFTYHNITGENRYNGGYLEAVVDGLGLKTMYSYDVLGRTQSVMTEGVPGLAEGASQYVFYTYDSAGRQTSTSESASAGGNPASDVVTSFVYDKAGLLVSTCRKMANLLPGSQPTPSLLNAVTNYEHSVGMSPLVQRVTFPDNSTLIQTVHLDGRIKSETGSARVPVYYEYTYDSLGRYSVSQSNSPPEDVVKVGLTTTTTDWLGMVVSIKVPEYSSTNQTARSEYLYQYSETGKLLSRSLHGSTGVELIADELFEYGPLGERRRSGTDLDDDGRLTPGVDRVVDTNAMYCLVDQEHWLQSVETIHTALSGATSIQTSKQLRMLMTLPQRGWSEERSYDKRGFLSRTTAVAERAQRRVTIWGVVPSITNQSSETYVNGLLLESRTVSGVTTHYSYDSMARLIGSVRGGQYRENIEYYPATNQVFRLGDNLHAFDANLHVFQYDVMGRRIQHFTHNSLDPDKINATAYYSYDSMGRLVRQWGSATQPVEYEYDMNGRLSAQRLFRGGSNWAGAVWPTTPGSADLTQYSYHNPTGLCVSRTLPLRTKPLLQTAPSVHRYDYNALGQVTQYTNARGGVVKYYYHNGKGYNTGELKSVDQDVHYAYKKQTGLLDYVIDKTGFRTFHYDPASSLQIAEFLDFNYYQEGSYLQRWHRELQPGWIHYGALNPSNPQVCYNYEQTTGRLAEVSGSLLGQSPVKYAYKPNTDLLSTVAVQGSGKITRSYEWDSSRPLLSHLTTSAGQATILQSAFKYDSLGRRYEETRNGLFHGAQLGGQTLIEYSQDAKGNLREFHSAHYPNGSGGSSEQLYGRLWNYDNGGNRTFDKDAVSGRESSWRVNQRNEVYKITPLAANSGVPEVDLSYDADGNLYSDGKWLYTCDRFNRLTTVSAINSSTLPQDSVTSVLFEYDYLGRRVSKKVYKKGVANCVETRFIWDGNNLLSEIDGLTKQVIRSYVWGLDKSGSVHGGGGVGGLLAVRKGSDLYYPLVDASGNIIGLLDSVGAIIEKYEMNPFGEAISETTSGVGNPFRFASKYFDSELGLYQYNNRYYSPSLGRFINPDPIQEAGGLNLYSIVGNDPVNQYDLLGFGKGDTATISNTTPIIWNGPSTITNNGFSGGGGGLGQFTDMSNFGKGPLIYMGVNVGPLGWILTKEQLDTMVGWVSGYNAPKSNVSNTSGSKNNKKPNPSNPTTSKGNTSTTTKPVAPPTEPPPPPPPQARIPQNSTAPNSGWGSTSLGFVATSPLAGRVFFGSATTSSVGSSAIFGGAAAELGLGGVVLGAQLTYGLGVLTHLDVLAPRTVGGFKPKAVAVATSMGTEAMSRRRFAVIGQGMPRIVTFVASHPGVESIFNATTNPWPVGVRPDTRGLNSRQAIELLSVTWVRYMKSQGAIFYDIGYDRSNMDKAPFSAYNAELEALGGYPYIIPVEWPSSFELGVPSY